MTEGRLGNIGGKIVKCRERKGITQRALAEESGVNYETLRKMERGHIKNMCVEKLFLISEALNVSLLLLLGIVEFPQDSPTACIPLLLGTKVYKTTFIKKGDIYIGTGSGIDSPFQKDLNLKPTKE